MPDLTSLADLRRRLQNGYVFLVEHRNNTTNAQAGIDRMKRLVDQYVTDLGVFVTTTDRATIAAEQARYFGRLEKGWLMDDAPEVWALFDQVLREYEVLIDAERGATEAANEWASRMQLIVSLRRLGRERKGLLV